MEDWTLPKLKSHQQWLLGRIDGYRWVYDNLKLDEQSKESLVRKISLTQDSEREASRYINQILAERAEVKAMQKEEQEALHRLMQDKS